MGISPNLLLEELERGRRIGQEEQRALIAQKLRSPFENLTAAAMAIGSMGKSDDKQKEAELASTASSLLNKSIEELQELAKELGDNPSLNQCPVRDSTVL